MMKIPVCHLIVCLIWLLAGSSGVGVAQSKMPVPICMKHLPPEVIAGGGLVANAKNLSTNSAENPYDTVYVSETMTTYLIFPEHVAVMDIGSRHYVGKIESGNMLYLKPLKAHVAPSSLLVRTTSGQVYLHYIAYRQQPKKIFWDYRIDSLETEPVTEGKEDAASAIREKKYVEQLTTLQKEPKQRTIARHKANGLQLKVNHLALDHETVYVRMRIENSTSIPYQLEYVSFAYQPRRDRKSERSISPEKRVIEPVAQLTVPVVAPHGSASLSYALPLHAGEKGSFLEIVIRETKGNRLLSTRIPAKKVAKARYVPGLPASAPVVN